MNFDKFKKVINAFKDACNFLENLDNIGISLYDSLLTLSNDYLFDEWLNSNFSDDGSDLIYWWLFEDVEKVIYDENKNPTSVEKLEDLFKFLEESKWILN